MEKLLVIDFGGQYAHLIAKRFRKLGFYTEIALPDTELVPDEKLKGIILSGGPSSVYEAGAPTLHSSVLNADVPILGLCYGHQIMSYLYGGKVGKAKIGEYGFTKFNKIKDSPLFENITFPAQVWMSHSDEVIVPGEGFDVIGNTDNCAFAALENSMKKRYSLQFHAEVIDTPIGMDLFQNFAKKICNMQKNWDSSQVLNTILSEIKNEAKDRKVLLFLSGGVDSSVAFALLNKALGTDRVLGLYIDNGFMRKNETEDIERIYKNAGYDNFIIERAELRFLNAVGKETDPQKKRKIIGETFITVRNDVLQRLNLDENEWLLAQGTLYPDIIESGGTKHSNVIKTHHNRVDGIKELIEKGLIIEPLKDLYKDEVRVIGSHIGLPDELVMRHPFPGPGISINLLCCDENAAFDEAESEQINNDLQNIKLDDFFEGSKYKLSVLPVKSVGVQGDFRTYTQPALLELDDLENNFPDWDKLEMASSHITNNVKKVNRAVLLLHKSKSDCRLIPSYLTRERLDMIREADAIVTSHLKKSGWYSKIFQHLTISLPYACANDKCSVVLRPVVSEDVMTARFANLDTALLKQIVKEIAALPFVDNIYYDITNKPPATFGWE